MEFEYSILDFIYEHIRCDFLDPIMAGFSYFAHLGIGWIVLGLVLLIPRKTRVAAATALIAMGIATLIGQGLLKHLIMRPRPYDAYPDFHGGLPIPFEINGHKETSSSFPSGHTCASFAAAVCFFKINRKAGIAATVLACLIAFSRLYNYAHFPTDILGGILFGVLSAFFTMWIFEKTNIDNKLLSIGRKKE